MNESERRKSAESWRKRRRRERGLSGKRGRLRGEKMRKGSKSRSCRGRKS